MKLGGVLGMHVRRGDSCKFERYCPPLNISYYKVAKEFQRRYGMRKIFVASDDQAAVDECKSWPDFDCKGLELSRDIYNYEDQEFLEVRARNHLKNTSSAAMDFFADLDTLAECDYFIGIFSSIMSRVAYELMFGRKGTHVPFASIQWPLAHTDGEIN